MAFDIRVGQEGRWELLSPFNNILKTDIKYNVCYNGVELLKEIQYAVFACKKQPIKLIKLIKHSCFH